jgi:hypothetical protein
MGFAAVDLVHHPATERPCFDSGLQPARVASGPFVIALACHCLPEIRMHASPNIWCDLIDRLAVRRNPVPHELSRSRRLRMMVPLHGETEQ